MNEHSEHTPRTIAPVLLTTRQAEVYVGKSAVLDYLRERHGLKPMFSNIGLGGRAKLWHRPTIDQHLLQLSATRETIQISPPCQENAANSNSKPANNSKPNASRRTA